MDDYKLTETLTRIEIKLDSLNSTYVGHLADHTDHEARLRVLEKKIWAFPSAAALVAALGVVAGFMGLR